VYLLFISFLVLIIDAVSRYRNRRLLARQILLQSLVNEKTQSLKQQNDLLEKNNSIKTRLISIISHDIVTPLKFLTVAGKGLIDNKEKLSDEVQRETLTDITQTAQELQLLSTNILNWIKYQNENRLLLPETFFPHQLTHQVFNLLGSLAKEKNIRLINSIDPSWKIEQFADPIRILIYNLVSNSIRYADGGAIEVGASKTSGDEYAIWVIDEGIGMKQETINHLLKEDVLVHNKTNESRSGHGLGYLIIKDLVRWIGGRIEIESEIGKGAQVSVFIRPRRRSKPVPIG
jgi:K+-sensing histidine kinase KdpD